VDQTLDHEAGLLEHAFQGSIGEEMDVFSDDIRSSIDCATARTHG
jgi:hypothetical protein